MKTDDPAVYWRCRTCQVAIPHARNDKVRAHLKTKRHQRLRNACLRCGSVRVVKIPGECWDRDGIREAEKCRRCRTEYKCYASGRAEKTRDEYTGDWPDHVREQEARDFDAEARRRGYTKTTDAPTTKETTS